MATREKDYLVFKSNYKQIKLETNTVTYIKALADYVIIVTEETQYVTQSTMKDIFKVLPSNFHRIHRSFIINENRIKKRTASNITIVHRNKEMSFNIGRTKKKEVKKAFSK